MCMCFVMYIISESLKFHCSQSKNKFHFISCECQLLSVLYSLYAVFSWVNLRKCLWQANRKHFLSLCVICIYLLSFYFRRCCLTQFDASMRKNERKKSATRGCVAQFKLMVRYKNQLGREYQKDCKIEFKHFKSARIFCCIIRHFVVVFTFTVVFVSKWRIFEICSCIEMNLLAVLANGSIHS